MAYLNSLDAHAGVKNVDDYDYVNDEHKMVIRKIVGDNGSFYTEVDGSLKSETVDALFDSGFTVFDDKITDTMSIYWNS